MAFTDNFTKVIDGNVHFNNGCGDSENLLEYTNQQCKECGCSGEWSLPDNADIDCDCVVARMYWNTVKLAEWENRGITYTEFRDLAKMGIPELLRLAKIGQRMQRVPVSERLPEESKPVIVCYKTICGESVSKASLERHRSAPVKYAWFFSDHTVITLESNQVTHWMPLPPLPETGEGE